MTCEEAEIAIGTWQHGALATTETAALEAHLLTCPSCRAFAAMSEKTEQTMQATMMEEVARIDWERIERGLKRVRESDKVSVWGSIAVAASLFAFVAINSSSAAFRSTMPRTLLFIGIVIGARLWQSRRSTESLIAAPDSSLELLVRYRQQTDTLLHRLRLSLLAVSGAGCAVTWFAWRLNQMHAATPTTLLLNLGVAAAMFVSLPFTFRSYRRLRAEARELA